MKTSAIVLSLLLLSASPAIAEDKAREEANQLLLRATELERFPSPETVKLRREARFSLSRPGMPDVAGTYVINRDSTTRWREDTEFAGFSFRELRVEKEIWTKKNNDFTPLPVEEFWRVVNNMSYRMTDANVVKRVHDRKVEGVDTRCIDFDTIRGKEVEEGQICAQRDPGYVVYWRYGTREAFYSKYSEFAGAQRPRHIKIVFAGVDTLAADVNYTLVESFQPDTFTPMVNAELRRYCANTQPAFAKIAPDPEWPRISSGHTGQVIVDVKIGTDGHVEKTEIAQTVSPDLDEAALAAVKKWVFEPARCDGETVSATTKVQVTYHREKR